MKRKFTVTEGSVQDGNPFGSVLYFNASSCSDAFCVICLHVYAHVVITVSKRGVTIVNFAQG